MRIDVARILLAAGHTSEALRHGLAALEDAEALADRTVGKPLVLAAVRALAYVYYNLEQFDHSIRLCLRGAKLAHEVKNLVIEGALLDSMGCAYGTMAYHASREGKPEQAAIFLQQAMDYSRRAMDLAHQAGHGHNEATARANLAEGLVQAGRAEQALSLMETAGNSFCDQPSIASHHFDTHGSILMALGRYAEAADLFKKAFEAAPAIHLSLVACEHLADACERGGDYKLALSHHQRFHGLYKQSASLSAQRSARVAAVRLETQHALATADKHRGIASNLRQANEQLTRQADDLRELSMLDALTGLANRRRMDQMLEEDPYGVGVVLIDIDHFKQINDGWSHLVGDAVLRQIGVLIRGCCRESDLPARYGGDEFAILLPTSEPGIARAIADRVRIVVESFDWRNLGAGLEVFVSVGCSNHGDPATGGTALALADRHLYEAKHEGRNRVRGGAVVLSP